MIHLDGEFFFFSTIISNYARSVANYLVGYKFDGCLNVVGFVMSLSTFSRYYL
jgi:hypothetical protein